MYMIAIIANHSYYSYNAPLRKGLKRELHHRIIQGEALLHLLLPARGLPSLRCRTDHCPPRGDPKRGIRQTNTFELITQSDF